MEKNLKIIVESSIEKENNILLSIIKRCLENDYLFRTYFADADIKLENKIVENFETDNTEERKNE